MAGESILLIEDELNVGSTLYERLIKDGFKVDWVKNISSAVTQINSSKYNLALIDVGLPDGTGFDFAEKLKTIQPQTAAVFLTAYSEPEDRIRGLELGAEDYITKPFHYKELLLRIQNIIKRTNAIINSKDDKVKIGNAIVNFIGFEVETNTNNIKIKTILTKKECSLLHFLYQKKGSAVSRDEILDHVWSRDEFPSPRTVDNFIIKLRRLIENDPENPKIIRSIRGVGYQLSEEE